MYLQTQTQTWLLCRYISVSAEMPKCRNADSYQLTRYSIKSDQPFLPTSFLAALTHTCLVQEPEEQHPYHPVALNDPSSSSTPTSARQSASSLSTPFVPMASVRTKFRDTILQAEGDIIIRNNVSNGSTRMFLYSMAGHI